MNAVIFTQDQYDDLVKRMDEILSTLSQKMGEPEEDFLDNLEFQKLMKISKRTCQEWRSQGIISFSQVGSKIYYRRSDIQKLLDKKQQKAFRK